MWYTQLTYYNSEIFFLSRGKHTPNILVDNIGFPFVLVLHCSSYLWESFFLAIGVEAHATYGTVHIVGWQAQTVRGGGHSS